jgi:hypothetical protein
MRRRTIYERYQAAMRKFMLAIERASTEKDFVQKETAYRWACAWADVARSYLLIRRY